MAMSGTPGVGDAVMRRQQVTGTLGVVVTVAVAVILGVHPFGSTGLYDDGPRFVEHVGALWVVIHFAGAMLLVAVPIAAAVASVCDHDWSWRFWLPATIAAMSLGSVSVTLVQSQWTTLSEMGLLRPAITLFLVWFGLTAYRLRRPVALVAPPTAPDAASQAGSQMA